jgi:hypothetical protein
VDFRALVQQLQLKGDVLEKLAKAKGRLGACSAGATSSACNSWFLPGLDLANLAS